MIKLRNILLLLAIIGMTAWFSSCDSEKELVIYEEDLPIMSETLYMLGSAAPCGWSITDPTPFTPTKRRPSYIYMGGNSRYG